MGFLKINRFINPLLFVLITGCSTSSFKVLNQTRTATEFLVSPNRVVLECEKVETDDRGIVYGFMLHVLDEEKTSFTMVQTNTLDKESCDHRTEKIQKILKRGSQIYLVGIGDFREPKILGKDRYDFPRLGSFQDNGRALQFIAIANEHKQCFAAFSAEEQPCPPEPFPLKK